MIIVEQGQVVDVCTEPGAYVYDKSTEPSLFGGDLKENASAMFEQIARRFSFGGDTGKDQRVYYINTKEIIGNKYGTPTAIPFKITNEDLNIRQTIHVRCFGEYSYRIVNPILFYTNVCGNVDSAYKRSEIDSQLKSELMTALQPAFANISAQRIGYEELPAHTMEIANALNEVLSKQWSEKRGIEVFSFGVSSVSVSDEDREILRRMQNMETDSASLTSTPAWQGRRALICQKKYTRICSEGRRRPCCTRTAFLWKWYLLCWGIHSWRPQKSMLVRLKRSLKKQWIKFPHPLLMRSPSGQMMRKPWQSWLDCVNENAHLFV